MAIQICAVTGNVKNLLGNNVQDVTVTAHIASPFVHPGGPAVIAGVQAQVITNSSGTFTLNLIETETVGQRMAITIDYFDGIAQRRKRTYAVVIPNAASATFTDLIIADQGTATIEVIPASRVTVVPAGNLTSTDVQSALEELQTDIDTRATEADLLAHTGASTGVHGVAGSVVGTTDGQTLTNKTLVLPVIAQIVNTGTLTLPTSTDTLVGRDTTDTLTNKTLTAPVIATIVNTGTLTLPTSTDTLVGRATTDTLTNKSISGSTNTLTNIPNGSTTATSANTPSTIVARDASGNFAASTITADIDKAGGTLSLGLNASIVNIGQSTATVNILGTVLSEQVTNLEISDKLITINDGGGAGSGSGAGIAVEEGGIDTGYVKTSGDRNSWQFLAPNTAGVTTLTPGAGSDNVTLNAATQTLTNKTLTTPIIAQISNTGTLTLPTSTDTLVGRATTDTLTNKTLTAPVISTIVNTGTLTLPSSTDTLVGRATTDTLTNKSISGSTNTLTNISLTASVTGVLPEANGGTNQSTYATGDILYASGANTLAKRTVGSTGQVLTVAGGVPTWATSSAFTSALGNEVTVDSGNGHGSTDNKVRRFSNIRKNVGTAITYADSATAGGTFTINTTGLYSISYNDRRGAGIGSIGIMVNSTATTTAQNLTYAQGSRATSQTISTLTSHISWTGNLTATDVVRAQTDGNSDATDSNCMFTITAIALS